MGSGIDTKPFKSLRHPQYESSASRRIVLMMSKDKYSQRLSSIMILIMGLISSRTFIRAHKRSSPILQRSLAQVLGSLDYKAFENGLTQAISCLFEVLDVKVIPTRPVKLKLDI